MKYLKKIFESDNNDPELEKILDAFINVIDVYGDPNIHDKDYSFVNKKQYTLIWEIFELGHSSDRTFDPALNSNNLVSMQQFVNHYLKNLHDQANTAWSLKDDLLSAEGRLSKDYDMKVNFKYFKSDYDPGKYILYITLYPKVKYDKEFITKFELGILHFDKKAINDFFGLNHERSLFSVEYRPDQAMCKLNTLTRGKHVGGMSNPLYYKYKARIYEFVAALRDEVKEKKLESQLKIYDVNDYLDIKILSPIEFSIRFD